MMPVKLIRFCALAAAVVATPSAELTLRAQTVIGPDEVLRAVTRVPGDSITDAVKCGFPEISRRLQERWEEATAIGARPAATVYGRPSLQTSLTRGGYTVHYDTTGSHAPALLSPSYQRLPGTAHAFAESVMAILDYVDPLQTTTLGYAPPPSDGGLGGGPEYDIYLLELGATYGYTTPDIALLPGDTTTSFITMDNDFIFVSPPSNRGLPALRVTVAHELSHAIQIGRYSYWYNDIYFYELSATWMEDVAYTEVNDYYNYLRASWGHFRNPQREFNSGSDFIMYSRGIWGQFLQKELNITVMRRCWEFTREYVPLRAIDGALQEAGSSFPEAFTQWTLWNYFTGSRSDEQNYYPEGSAFPVVAQVPVGYSPPGREITDSLRSLAARYYQVLLPAETLTVALSNANLTAALGGGLSYHHYTLKISSTKDDAGFQETGTGVFVKLDVPDPAAWGTWFLADGSIIGPEPPEVDEATPFPNPFVADGSRELFIPLDGAAGQEGDLQVYSASMDLVYSTRVISRAVLGRQAVVWNGRTSSGETVATGVYILLLKLRDRTLTSKVALIRR
jgi:hypothetical protein